MPPQNQQQPIANPPPQRSQRLPTKIYTSVNTNLPASLSYQNIKLANFIELQLTDLQKSLVEVKDVGSLNLMKDSLSKAYNVFHEMEKIYLDLDVAFLYHQGKKLVSSFGVIFVYLIEFVERNAGKSQQNEVAINSNVKNIKLLEQKGSQSVKQNKVGSEVKAQKKQRGIHLFNQSYARYIDYNIEQFKHIREKMNESILSDEQKQAIKFENQRKFKKEVVDEINDTSYLKIFQDEISLFLNQQKRLEDIKTISLSDELEKIVRFFRDSESEALEFVKKEKSNECFLGLTEGYNEVMSEYQLMREHQFNLLHNKLNEIFVNIKKQNQYLQAKLAGKDKEIEDIKAMMREKKQKVSSKQTQTTHCFDEEIRQLHKRLAQNTQFTEQLELKMIKMNEDNKREKDLLIIQINERESVCESVKEHMSQKINFIAKLEKKLKLAHVSNENRNIKDPVALFKSFDPELKEHFISQLKENGLILTEKNAKRVSKQVSKRSDNHDDVQDSADNTKSNSRQKVNRQVSYESFQLRSSSNRKQKDPKGENEGQNSLCIKDGLKSRTSQIYSLLAEGEDQMDFIRSSRNEIKSKKMISVRHINDPPKSKVFDEEKKYLNSSIKGSVAGKTQLRSFCSIGKSEQGEEQQEKQWKGHHQKKGGKQENGEREVLEQREIRQGQGYKKKKSEDCRNMRSQQTKNKESLLGQGLLREQQKYENTNSYVISLKEVERTTPFVEKPNILKSDMHKTKFNQNEVPSKGNSSSFGSQNQKTSKEQSSRLSAKQTAIAHVNSNAGKQQNKIKGLSDSMEKTRKQQNKAKNAEMIRKQKEWKQHEYKAVKTVKDQPVAAKSKKGEGLKQVRAQQKNERQHNLSKTHGFERTRDKTDSNYQLEGKHEPKVKWISENQREAKCKPKQYSIQSCFSFAINNMIVACDQTSHIQRPLQLNKPSEEEQNNYSKTSTRQLRQVTCRSKRSFRNRSQDDMLEEIQKPWRNSNDLCKKSKNTFDIKLFNGDVGNGEREMSEATRIGKEVCEWSIEKDEKSNCLTGNMNRLSSDGKIRNSIGSLPHSFKKIANLKDSTKQKQNRSALQFTDYYQSQSESNEIRSLLLKNLPKAKNLTKAQFLQKSELIKNLAQRFEDKEVKKAALEFKTVQQFSSKVAKLHEKRCGTECKHLQKYVQIFKRIRQQSSPHKAVMKMHIENLHEKFEIALNLPEIRK